MHKIVLSSQYCMPRQPCFTVFVSVVINNFFFNIPSANSTMDLTNYHHTEVRI